MVQIETPQEQGREEAHKDTSPAPPVDAGPDSAASAVAEDNAVVTGDDPEPEPTDVDPGDDQLPGGEPDVNEESVVADPDDTHGANDHPEA